MSKFIFTEKKMAEVVTNAVHRAMLEGPVPQAKPVPENLRLDSIVQLAGFLGCSYNWAKQLKKEGRIRYFREGPKVMFFLSDILDAVEKDSSIRRMFLARISTGPYDHTTARLHDETNRVVGQSDSRAVVPKILVETELYPGRFIFATIKYQGWRCNACIPYHLWNDSEKVTDFVEQIVRARHEKRPFRIPPAIN